MMNNEYVRSREEFDPVFYIIGLIIFAVLYWIINRDKKEINKEDKTEGDPKKTFFTKQ